MSDDTNQTAAELDRVTARRWIEAFNARDDQGEAEARTADYTAHAPESIEPKTLDASAWREFLDGFLEGFPDLHLTIEDAVADGDFTAQRITFQGTHTGTFQGLPPTGRKVHFGGIEINRMAGGKVAEHWFQLDQVAMLQQLGLMVVPGPRLLPRLIGHAVTKPLRRR